MANIKPDGDHPGVAAKRDGVTTAFEVILEELNAVIVQVNSQGAEFMRNANYLEAQRVIESGKHLQVFREKLSRLKDEWIAGHDPSVRQRVQIDNVRQISPHHKAAKTGLSVTLPGGRDIHHPVAADTFVEALQELGLERVKALNIRVNGIPLVASERNYDYTQAKVGPYWVITHSNTEYKRKLLTEIGERLGVRLIVKIVR